jgi:hypothetical protein
MKRFLSLILSITTLFIVILSIHSCAKNDNSKAGSTSTTATEITDISTNTDKVSVFDIVRIGMSVSEYEDIANTHLNGDRSYQKCTHFDFWLDANGKNVVLQKEYRQNGGIVSKLELYDAVCAEKSDFSKLSVGMTVGEMVSLVGIPYLYNGALAIPVVEYRTVDGAEYRIELDGDKINKITELDSDINAAISRLESAIGSSFDLEAFELKRIYLHQAEAAEKKYGKDVDNTDYFFRIEGTHSSDNTEWNIDLRVYEKFAYDFYYDFNNHFIIYNVELTDRYNLMVTETNTLFINDVAKLFETGGYTVYR